MGRKTDSRVAIRKAQQAAKAKAGVCLSTHYINSSSKLQWRCRHGHDWQASFNAVVNCGQWCAECSYAVREGRPRSAWSTTVWKKRTPSKPVTSTKPVISKPDTLDEPEVIQLTKDEQAAIDFILNRTPDDTSRIRGIDKQEQHELSKEENGYLRAHMPTRWRCTKGHEWDATFNAVKVHGFGCPECKALIPTPLNARPKKKSRMGPMGPRRTPAESLAVAQTVTESHGGECLSTEFTRTCDKLTWRCAEGHEWDATFNTVVHVGTWCPECADAGHAEFMRGKQYAKNT